MKNRWTGSWFIRTGSSETETSVPGIRRALRPCSTGWAPINLLVFLQHTGLNILAWTYWSVFNIYWSVSIILVCLPLPPWWSRRRFWGHLRGSLSQPLRSPSEPEVLISLRRPFLGTACGSGGRASRLETWRSLVRSTAPPILSDA